MIHTSLARAILMLGVLPLASCQLFRKPPPPPAPVKQEYKYPGEWTGGDKAITHMVVNVDVQRATLYHGDEVVGWTYLASGIPSFPTPTGSFKIQEKITDKVSNLYGKGYDKDGKLVNSDFKQGRDLLPEGGRFEPAKMPLFMRLTSDGVGMHIGPIPNPGRRASHGCIRLPSKMATILYQRLSIGTSVTIVGRGPEYSSYLAQSSKKAAENAAKFAAAQKKAAEAAAAALTPNSPPAAVPPAGTLPTEIPVPPPVEVKPAIPAPAQ